MRDILVTSSVLILALLVLRQVFRKTISRRAQYALWGLVLLRLLVPVSLPAMEHNVLTTAEPVGAAVTERIDYTSVYLDPVGQSERAQSYVGPPDTSTPAVAVRDSRSDMVYEHDYHELNAAAWIMSEDGAMTWYAKALPLTDILTCIWYAGIAVMACWLVISNLLFWRKLRKVRVPYSFENCAHPVYLVESGLPSPCLFGLFRPAIYLTPAAVSTLERARHVLAHETTHARHLDPLWSLLRGVCLAVYWFNPLVWAAALASRTDCELACDEGALKRLGETERIAYGRTLLSLIPVAKKPANPVLTATTMTSDKRRLKDRVTRIAENRQTRAAALFAAAAVAVLLCVVTFTGAKTSAASQPLSAEELAQFNADFFGEQENAPFRRQFLTSLYEQPEDIDMFQLFYNGTGQPGVAEPGERTLLVDTYYDGADPEVDLTKLPAREIDQVLERYTGLTLAETQALGMENFQYLADYDAYYHTHGDTNAIVGVTFAAGEREGDLTRLYYRADGMYLGGEFAEGWACLTLREVPGEFEDGFPYHFVSHQLCERPDHLLSDVIALNGEELAYFNETFFNNDTVDNVVGLNIHNQFLNSLYERPEDIDLYELFYCGTGLDETMSDAERQLVCSFDPEGEEICPTDKLSVSAINSVLLANTGLTLEQTNQTGLESFTYLEQYDSYYHTHGDTNYFHSVQITAGTREGGTIRLYYPDSSAKYDCDWLCVTLEEQSDGSCWFISNLPSEKPVVPTVYPEWEPVLTVPLTDLEPYEAPAVTVERHTGDVEQRLYGIMANEDYAIDIYRSTDGNTYAAVASPLASEDWAEDCFLTFPEGEDFSDITVTGFYDLLGRSGVAISYYGWINDRYYGTFNDYYYVTDEGVPALLARAFGDVCVSDLDGDGEFELAASAGGPVQLFFQRDGVLYCADIEALVESAWTEAQYLSFGRWDMYSRCLSLSGEVPIPDSDMQSTATRYLYFNGSELLLYRDETAYTDHVKDTVNAPEDVLAIAREYVLSRYVQGVLCYDLVDGDMVEVQDDYDDWRIMDLSGPYYEDIGGLRIEVWRLGYECHTSTKHQVLLAGGSYITEDGWCMIGYPSCDYLYFQVDESGNRAHLYTAMENDCAPGTELFRTDMVNQLTSMGLLALEDVDGQTLLEMLSGQPAAFLNRLAENQPEAVQTAVIEKLGTYIALGGSDSGAEAYASCVSYIDRWPSDFTPEAQALWQRLQARIAEGPQAAEISAPPAVLAAAQEKAAAEFEAFRAQDWAADARYDGWRISYLAPAAVTAFGDASVTAAVYQMGCAYHAARPEAVALAGGMEMTEDGWVSGLSSGYLVFLMDGGRYTLLDGEIAFDTSPDAPAFRAELAMVLLENGLLAPSQLDADTLLHMFYCGYPPYFLNRMGTHPAAERRAVIQALASFHNQGGENERGLFRDAMQTAAWGIRDLDANGQTFWRELLDQTGITPGGIGGTYTDLDTAIHASILDHRENASGHAYAFHAEAHSVLDTARTGSTCTVYLLFQFGDYEPAGSGYQMSTGGAEAAALTFAAVNGQYQLIEFWTPRGGSYRASDIRTCFPVEAAETAVNPGSELLDTLKTQLDAAAAETAAQTFTKADVEFSGQALSAETDTMTYDERWAWCEAGGGVENSIGFAVKTAQTQDGYIAYNGNLTGVSPGASAWKYLYLRFPDGTLANLPLPKNNLIGTPLVDNGLFADGKFIYSVSFPEKMMDGDILVHLKGTYRYEVDLSAKTVSLTVLDN